MYTHADKKKEKIDQSDSNGFTKLVSSNKPTFQFVDNRPEALSQRQLQLEVNNLKYVDLKLEEISKIEETIPSQQVQKVQPSSDIDAQSTADYPDSTIQRVEYDVVPGNQKFVSNARNRNRGTYARIKTNLIQVNTILKILFSDQFTMTEKIKYANMLVDTSLPNLIVSCKHHLRDDKGFNQSRRDNSTALLSGAERTLIYITKFIEYMEEPQEDDARRSESFEEMPMMINEIDFMEEIPINEKASESVSEEMVEVKDLEEEISIGSEEVEKGYASMEPKNLLLALNNPKFFIGFRDRLLGELLGGIRTTQVYQLETENRIAIIYNILRKEGVPNKERSRLIPLFIINRKEAVRQAIIAIHGLDGPEGYTGNKACEAAATVLKRMIDGPWEIKKRIEGGLASHYFLQDGNVIIDGTWKQFIADHLYLSEEERSDILESLPDIFVGTLKQLKKIYKKNTLLSKEEINNELNIWRLAK